MQDIASFLQYLKNQKRYSNHTLTAYSDDLIQFYTFCKDLTTDSYDFLKINHNIIRMWVAYLMENNFSARSVKRKISSLKSFYKYLQKEGKISYNPASRIISPKIEKKLPAFVSAESMDNLLTNIEFGEDFKGKRNRLVIDLLYQTGIRLSELINLKSANVDIHTMQIKVVGKRNKERIIPITPNLFESIQDYLSEKSNLNHPEENYLFVTEKGNRVYPKLIYRIVNNYLRLITTIEKKSPHVLRHTFATQMLNAGAELNAIKEILGHSNLSATEIYTHNTFKKLKSIYKQAHPRA